MPMMPKRVKYRKSQRGRVRGNATRGNYVAFGEFGLQSLEAGWLSAESIEAGRIVASQSISGEGKLYIRVFPHKSVTSIPAETRMGKGKGEPEYWAAVVKPGTSCSRLGGLREEAARDCLARVAYKMPVHCRFVTPADVRHDLIGRRESAEDRHEQARRTPRQSDEQLDLPAQGDQQEPVPAPPPERDRAAGGARARSSRPSGRSPGSRRSSASARSNENGRRRRDPVACNLLAPREPR